MIDINTSSKVYPIQGMKPATRYIIISLSLAFLLIVPATAGTYTEARGVTCQGPLGLLIPLGFENSVPAATAVWIYNMICILLLFLLGAASGERNTRFFSVLIPMMAGMFVYFGWLHTPNATATWSIILGAGILAGMIYMKESLRENWGIGGPGETLMNIAFYLIILQCVIGVVNGSGIFESNAPLAVTPAEYQSVDLTEQINDISDTGGLMGDIQSVANILWSMGVGALRAFIQILKAITLSSVVILEAFPFLQGSTLVTGILIAFNIGEWLLFAKLALDFYYFKNTFSTQV